MHDLIQTKQYYADFHKKTDMKCRVLHEFTQFDVALRTHWRNKGPQYNDFIQRITDYKQDLIECTMEMKLSDETIKQHEVTLNNFKTHTYDTTLLKLQTLVDTSKKHLEASKTLLEKELENEKIRGGQLIQSLYSVAV